MINFWVIQDVITNKIVGRDGWLVVGIRRSSIRVRNKFPRGQLTGPSGGLVRQVADGVCYPSPISCGAVMIMRFPLPAGPTISRPSPIPSTLLERS